MALSQYCMNCGGKTEYISVKPTFCGQCGKAFMAGKPFVANSAAKTSIQQPKPIIKQSKISKPNLEVKFEDDNQSTFIPDISKLEADIEPQRGNTITLGELAKEPKTGYQRGKVKKVSVKQSIEEFKREAGFRSKNSPRDVIIIEDNGAE